MASLHPCPSCSRHVRATETSCPFCGADVPQAVAKTTFVNAPRMTRAAILFASATTIAACGGKEADDINKVSQDDAGGSGGGGGASSSSTSSSGSSGTSGTSGTPVPMYGPAVIDAGDDGGKDRDRDGGVKRDGGVVALYGPAPVDAGG